ncbi:glycosyl hydrolase [Aliikangiella marina]|uniref:Glycosyl hydrolase n=1 Tax=Aliikangiella marina TaxID=1712262 RepID=A0A545TJ02_9GAMM|nr:glycosyl hydrolase [Aliikangiella marina]TQV77214.1 glycosyl hydrolase [Aliikangiella marina]
MLCIRTSIVLILTFFIIFNSEPIKAADNISAAAKAFEGLEFRSLGPYRGGRSASVEGFDNEPGTYLMGVTGGGVWRTIDDGHSWHNISDGYFGGSIGDIAIAPSDTNVIYVGGGEKTIRGNVSHGEGVWKTTDKGKTWLNVGLTDSRHVPQIQVHPKDANLVYVAALGHLYGANEQRGIFRSKNGGQSWEKILFVNDEVGAIDIKLDPTNPRIIYASTWRVKRTPYNLSSGGEGSGLWKSVDGGDTWNNISTNQGLPREILGISGFAVSPVVQGVVWAIIEAKDGGLFRSDDGGENWRKVNEENKLRQRAWYYTRVYADPKNVDTVYVLNVRFHKSTDGGKSFKSIATPHGDHHDLWIDPKNPSRMAVADDGGVQISNNGGISWTTYFNQPTAQFYRVTTDNHFPYRIYAAQQDNSTVRLNHRSDGGGIDLYDWQPTAGGESGHIAPHAEKPDIVYGGSYMGYLTRYDHQRKNMRSINVWPESYMGSGAGDVKYRFQWNFPIFFSPHDSNKLYTAGNHLFLSTNEGQSWEIISPDLTRNDPATLGPSGGPITKDNTSVEYYGTIFAALESYHEPGVLWTGSDDGLVYISRDAGKNWKNITPRKLPKWTQINSIEIDPFNKGGLFIAATRYKSNDFRPYLFHTKNYGKSWRRIDDGIKQDHFTRVIRADKKRKGLLYAGTESGLYISFDNGEEWQPVQLNLPISPITDLALKNDDLVVATQGRSLWIMDDLNPIRNFDIKNLQQPSLIKPRDTYRFDNYEPSAPGPRAENLKNGVMVNFYLPVEPLLKSTHKKDKQGKEALTLIFKDASGTELKRFATTAKEKHQLMTAKQGFNRFFWNLRTEPPRSFKGMMMWARRMQGYKVVPGEYQVTLKMGEYESTQAFTILKDPRTIATEEDFNLQLAFAKEAWQLLDDTHKAIADIRALKSEIKRLKTSLASDDKYKPLIEMGDSIVEKIDKIENTLYQTKSKAPQDPLGFPVKLNDKLNSVFGLTQWGDRRPTDQAVEVKALLTEKINEQLAAFEAVKAEDLSNFNQKVLELKVPMLMVK